MGIIIVIAAAILVVMICCIIILHYNKKNRYALNNKQILVNSGRLVNDNAIGKGGGGLLYGEFEDLKTIYVQQPERYAPYQQGINMCLIDMESQNSYSINVSSNIVLGSGTFSDTGGVCICAYGISREHCCLYLDNGILMVRDLNSTNHTYVNGNMVMGDVTLHDGDILQLGIHQYYVKVIY